MVGEWKNYFTPEQNERFEKEVLEKLRGRETTGNSSINDIEYWYRYQATLLVYVGRLHSLHRKACVADSVIRTKVKFREKSAWYTRLISSHFGATCIVCNVLHGWLKGQKNEQQDNAPNP